MKHIIQTKYAPKAIGPYSQAIQTNNYVFTSGQIPIDIISGLIPEKIEEQTYIALINIKSIINAAGLEVKDIIKINIFTTHLKDFDMINHVYEKFFIENQSSFPARSCVEVKGLPKNAKIEIEAIAFFKKI